MALAELLRQIGVACPVSIVPADAVSVRFCDKEGDDAVPVAALIGVSIAIYDIEALQTVRAVGPFTSCSTATLRQHAVMYAFRYHVVTELLVVVHVQVGVGSRRCACNVSKTNGNGIK